jgi:hypothetical protein
MHIRYNQYNYTGPARAKNHPVPEGHGAECR